MNPPFSHTQYLELRKAVDKEALSNWYVISYDLFAKQKLESFVDLIRIVAYAYSWMPTIPHVSLPVNKTDRDQLVNELNGIDKLNWEEKRELVTKMAGYINNSPVGASKVMHFINSDVPIIDSNVVKGWNAFFKPYHDAGNAEVVKFPKTMTNTQKRFKDYIKYWQGMEQWVKSCKENGEKVNMRRLELDLYLYGKQNGEDNS